MIFFKILREYEAQNLSLATSIFYPYYLLFKIEHSGKVSTNSIQFNVFHLSQKMYLPLYQLSMLYSNI